MIDILTIVHFCTSVAALVVTGLMAVGFVRLARFSGGLIRHFAVGIVTIHAAAFLRTLYRDVAPVFADDGSVIFTRTVALGVALALNGLIALAGWHGLRALYLAIPEGERGRYSLLTAALYPRLR